MRPHLVSACHPLNVGREYASCPCSQVAEPSMRLWLSAEHELRKLEASASSAGIRDEQRSIRIWYYPGIVRGSWGPWMV